MKKKIWISLLFLVLIGGTTYAYKNSSEPSQSIPLRKFNGCECYWERGTCLTEIIITPGPVTAPVLGSVDPTRP